MRGVYLRALLVVTSLVGGMAILVTSLLAGNSTVLSTSGVYETSQKQLYWSKDILPDHVAYPALMIADRARLEVAEPTDRLYLQLEYGRRRFEAGEALLDKNNPELALTTITKAQKYWLQAGHTAIENQGELSETVRLFTLRTLDFYLEELEAIKPRFGDADRVVIDTHLAELKAIAAQLRTVLAVAQ